jgi:large subunit ribosomal protein L27
MAHKKGQGSTRNGRDSWGQRRGVKVFGGEQVRAGMILVRQLGTPIRAGRGVGEGRDHTLYARRDGVVRYYESGNRRYASIE